MRREELISSRNQQNVVKLVKLLKLYYTKNRNTLIKLSTVLIDQNSISNKDQ